MSNFKRGPMQQESRDRGRYQPGNSPRGGNHNNRNNGAFNRNAPPLNRLNPWEGGITPGVGNTMGMGMGSHNMMNSRSSGGLLPTPTMSNAASGLLQQFSNQDVQLALASNVLSALLPGLQASQQNQVQPLLSLNPNRGGLLPLGAPPMNSFQNQNFGRPQNNNLAPNRPHHSNAIRRPQPYNKMGNRNQRQGQKNDGANSSARSGGRNAGPSPKNVSQQAKHVKPEDSKKGDGRMDKKKEDSAKEKIKVERNVKEKDKEADTDKSKAAFAGVASDKFYCHICSKHMWDAPSFSNHIKGRAHQMMMDEREESYRIKIEMMRHDLKVEEQQRQISLERKQRQGKAVAPQSREYCTMCDLHFIGSLTAHRKNNSHQKLKSFLHPKCEDCHQEFPTRLEWDQHLLSAGHLKAAVKIPGQEAEQVGEVSKSEAVILKTESNDMKKDERVVGKEPIKDGKCATSPQCMTVKKEDPIPSLLPVDKLPEYDPQREIGFEMLQEKTGYLCRCCNRFLSCSTDAKTHCRSQFHYEKYINHLNSKVTLPSTPKRSGSELSLTSPIKTPKLEGKSPDVRELEEEEEDEDGNWKRRKVAKEDVSNDTQDDAQTINGDTSSENTVEGVQETTPKIDEEIKQITDPTQEDAFNSSSQEMLQETKGGEEEKMDGSKTCDELQTIEEDKEQDSSQNAEKTMTEEEKPLPTKARRGRGGTAIRSRGRKRKSIA